MINIHFNFKGHKALVIGGSRGIGKSVALKLLEADMQEMISISDRWESDMGSDSWASKNVRPYSLAFLFLPVLNKYLWTVGCLPGALRHMHQ